MVATPDPASIHTYNVQIRLSDQEFDRFLLLMIFYDYFLSCWRVGSHQHPLEGKIWPACLIPGPKLFYRTLQTTQKCKPNFFINFKWKWQIAYTWNSTKPFPVILARSGLANSKSHNLSSIYVLPNEIAFLHLSMACIKPDSQLKYIFYITHRLFSKIASCS